MWKEPVPHLFIVSDEFAELKDQQPEFMSHAYQHGPHRAQSGSSLDSGHPEACRPGERADLEQLQIQALPKVQDVSDSKEVLKSPLGR